MTTETQAMTDNIKFQDADNENACVVCFRSCLIYSIGSCNHAVCFECSARMRCICLQNECPICRQDLPKVIFTKTVAPFANLDRDLRSGLYEKKYRIAFADLEIQKAFYRLLENQCPECDHTPFIEFHKLKEHVRKVHELFYCEICTEHLKIFSSQRRCYTRQMLATHRRVGDPNDKSHKGHPRCEYCELRFLDKDLLFGHLRREHYFCHLCDADGILLFFGATAELIEHFKAEHFLCEDEECREEQTTWSVFRTEIDLRAHIATSHSKNMSRSEVKQARTLDLEFSYAPRGRGGGAPENSRGGRSRPNDPQREFDRIPEQQIVQQPQIQIDTKNKEQFPSLAGPAGSGGSSVQLSNTVRHIVYGTSGLARTKENFPALGGGVSNEKPGKPQSQPVASGKKSKTPTASSLLKGQSKSNNRQSSTLSSTVSLKKDSNDFPALSAPSMSSNSRPSPLAYSSVRREAPVRKEVPATFSRPSTASATRNKETSDFPSLSSGAKNRNKNDLLMEDMVLPESNINKNLMASKHRGLVDEYVSMASTVSKVRTVQKKEDSVPVDFVKKSVPKLNSADNFPTLGGGGGPSSSAPQWFTESNQKVQPEVKDAPKKGKKVHEMPVNTINGLKTEDTRKTSNGSDKEKTKSANGNKENNNENIFVEKSFPVLGTPPPPGFSAVKKAPPGFANISNTNEDTTYFYQPPNNASKRNQALVSEFQKTLNTPEAMKEFRNVSQMFRDGNYYSKSYYETCQHVLGENFKSIFPELLALLPDIDKQQSLYNIHLETLRRSENPGTKTKKKKSKELEVCATCKQVLLTSDLITHLQSHALENSFPVLNTAVEVSEKQWKK